MPEDEQPLKALPVSNDEDITKDIVVASGHEAEQILRAQAVAKNGTIHTHGGETRYARTVLLKQPQELRHVYRHEWSVTYRQGAPLRRLIYYFRECSRDARTFTKVADQRAKRVADAEGRSARLRPKAALRSSSEVVARSTTRQVSASFESDSFEQASRSARNFPRACTKNAHDSRSWLRLSNGESPRPGERRCDG
jgi:hypothetical protein